VEVHIYRPVAVGMVVQLLSLVANALKSQARAVDTPVAAIPILFLCRTVVMVWMEDCIRSGVVQAKSQHREHVGPMEENPRANILLPCQIIGP
jgi:hypothetical protein